MFILAPGLTMPKVSLAWITWLSVSGMLGAAPLKPPGGRFVRLSQCHTYVKLLKVSKVGSPVSVSPVFCTDGPDNDGTNCSFMPFTANSLYSLTISLARADMPQWNATGITSAGFTESNASFSARKRLKI